MTAKKIKLSSIKPNPDNPRIVKDDKFYKLVESIKQFGDKMFPLRPIVIDENRIILGGNMRHKALKHLKYKEVPNTWIKQADDLTEDEKKEFIIKDNVGFGAWDWDVLSNEWDANLLDSWGLDIPDFEVEELDAQEDNYEEPEQMQVDVVQGDLIEFVCDDGRIHRLICGDSTCSDTVEKLMNGEKIQLLLTDPPYGIGADRQHFEGHGWTLRRKTEWDKMKPENGALKYLCSITDSQIIWGGNYFTDDLPPTMGWLIWDKGQRDFSLADGEMAWTSFNNAMRIKSYSRAAANKEQRNHPTQKPIEIINWCFKYADRHAKTEIKTVLDAYIGSGSTMAAAHQLNRICYGMELDPNYCQVIIDRMQKLDSSIKVKINNKEYKQEEIYF